MFPTGQLRDALRPSRNVRKGVQIDPGFLGIVEIAVHRDVGDSWTVADDVGVRLQVALDDVERALHATAKEVDDLPVVTLLNADQPAQGGKVTGELVVVEQDPAPDLATLGGIVRAEVAGLLDQVIEDDAGLRDALVTVEQHRRFAHDAHAVAVRIATRLATEIIDPARLPVDARQGQHESNFVAIAGFGEAIKRVFGHDLLLSVRNSSARSLIASNVAG